MNPTPSTARTSHATHHTRNGHPGGPKATLGLTCAFCTLCLSRHDRATSLRQRGMRDPLKGSMQVYHHSVHAVSQLIFTISHKRRARGCDNQPIRAALISTGFLMRWCNLASMLIERIASRYCALFPLVQVVVKPRLGCCESCSYVHTMAAMPGSSRATRRLPSSRIGIAYPVAAINQVVDREIHQPRLNTLTTKEFKPWAESLFPVCRNSRALTFHSMALISILLA